MNLRVTTTLSPDSALDSGLAEAIRKCAGPSPTSCVIVLPPAVRPTRELVEIIGREATALARGSELILVHPSTNLGFLASSAALRVPHVKISYRAQLQDVPQETAHQRSSIEPPDASSSSVASAFARSKQEGSVTCVIHLDDDLRSPRTIVDLIEASAKRHPVVKTIYLVHPTPIAGFIASTLALRLPFVAVRAVASKHLVPP